MVVISLLSLGVSLTRMAYAKAVDKPLRDVEGAVKSSTKLKSDSAAAEGTICLQCTGVPGSAEAKVPPQCDLKGPRDDLKLIPKNWGLEATGADLIQDEPSFKALRYTSGLAVVDSGLQLRGNPDAGTTLSKGSPEVDSGHFHGSHVSGTAASRAYGVNPNLPTKVYSVGVEKYSETPDTAGLLNAFSRAVDDASVKVVNLSWSFYEQPKMVDLVRRATEKGKWIVFAAGNESQVANIQTTGHEHFAHNPSFFKVGSSSYFGAPSFFSNYGPDVTAYAPGSHIRSLNGDYNPNYHDTNTSALMDGTSMASPHFSAVLSTLANLAPKMSSSAVKHLIATTSINRGTAQRPFPFLNAYMAFRTLDDAKSCMNAAPAGNEAAANACLDASAKKLRATAHLPKQPRGSACAEWRAYYVSLRKAYFLSSGDPAVAEAIAQLFASETKPIAEKFLFSNPHERAAVREGLNDATIPGAYKAERTAAQTFASGGMDLNQIKAETSESSGSAQGKHPLDLMLPVRENFDEFMKYCASTLKSEPSGAPCTTFVINAPRDFKERLIKEMGRRTPPVHNTEILHGLDFEYDSAWNDQVKALYQAGAADCLRTNACTSDDLEAFFDSDYVSPDQKQRLIRTMLQRSEASADLRNKDSNIAYWRTLSSVNDTARSEDVRARDLAATLGKFADAKDFSLTNKLKLPYEPGESPATSELRYAALMATRGQNPANLPDRISRAVNAAQDFQHFETDGMTTRVSFDRIIASDSANGLAEYLTKPLAMKLTHRAFHDSAGFAQLIAKLLKSDKVDEAHKKALVDALSKATRSGELPGLVVAGSIVPEIKDEPVAKKWMMETKTPEGAKLYPDLANAAHWRSAGLDHDTPEFRALIAENANQPSAWILRADPDLTLKNPSARALVTRTFDDLKNKPLIKGQQYEIWAWIRDLKGDALKAYAPHVLDALPNLTSAEVPVGALMKLVSRLVDASGRDEKLMARTIEALRPLIKDERFLWRTDASNVQTKAEYEQMGRAFQDDRGANILLKSYALINDSAAGRKLLERSPVWAELNTMAKSSGVKSDLPIIDSHATDPVSASIPRPMSTYYVAEVKDYLSRISVRDVSRPGASPFETALGSDPTLLPALVDRLKAEPDNSPISRYLGRLALHFAQRSPDNARLVLNRLGSSDATVPLSGGIFTVDRPLKETIGRFADYDH